MVRIRCFHCHGPGSIPGWRTEIPSAAHMAKINRNLGLTSQWGPLGHLTGGLRQKDLFWDSALVGRCGECCDCVGVGWCGWEAGSSVTGVLTSLTVKAGGTKPV